MARKFLYVIALIIVVAVGLRLAWEVWQDDIIRWYAVPDQPFVEQPPVPQARYAAADMWFSRPGVRQNNPTRWAPAGYRPSSREDVAVFYIHPTSYLTGERWNAPLDDAESQQRARVFLRSQASVFNGIGVVWAPRYRQATFGAFLTDQPEAGQALAAAYGDVLAAFDAFVAAIPADKPIVLAGHSQGSLHLIHLLKDRVAGKPLATRIVAAYAVGWPVSVEHDMPSLGLPACTGADQTGCLLSWSSFAEPADPGEIVAVYDRSTGFDGQSRADSPILCTNPLTGGAAPTAPMTRNLGTLVPNADLTDGELVPQAVPARCDDRGFLLIGDPPEMGNYVLPGNNYHVYDYPLFWVNARTDVERRVAAFLAR